MSGTIEYMSYYHKITFLVTTLLMICLFIVFHCNPKVELVCKKIVKGRIEEIYTIQYLPRGNEDIKNVVYKNTQNMPFPEEDCTRVYMEKNWRNGYSLIWGQELDYDKNSCTVESINTKIAVVEKHRLLSGKDTVEYYFYYW